MNLGAYDLGNSSLRLPFIGSMLKIVSVRKILKSLLFSVQHQQNPNDGKTEDFNIRKIIN